MKFVLFASLIASALAVPAELAPRTGSPSVCPPGLFSNPLCCSADVLGVISLDCDTPSEQPRDGRSFQSICQKGGKQPRCCVLPVASQAVLCQNAVGAR